MADIYGDQDPGDLNDTLTGTSGDDTIYGGDGNDLVDAGEGNDTIYGNSGNKTIYGGGGNDTIHAGIGSHAISGGDGGDIISSGAGHLVVDGGTGSDTITAGGTAEFYFGADFGNDVISAADSSTVNFSFARPDGLRLHRNEKDLYIETLDGILRIKDYFQAPTRFEISFDNGSDILSTSVILDAIVNGGDNDELLGARFEETSTDIIVHGGAGDDRLESSDVAGSAGVGRTTYMDGGAGDDVYVSGSENLFLAFSRESGRDIFLGKGVDGDGPSGQNITIELSETLGGATSLSDLSIAYEGGNFVLHIADSDAALVITLPQALRIMKGIDSWNAETGSGTLDLQTLLDPVWTAQFGDSSFLTGSTDLDGSILSNESVFIGTGTFTSGSDDETIYAAGKTIFHSGFGNDTVVGGMPLEFDQDATDFTFSRNGRDLIIDDLSGNVATVRGFLSAGGLLSHSTGDTLLTFNGNKLTWLELETALAAASTSTEMTLEDGDNFSSGLPVEASNQLIHANLGTITVNAGSGNNIIDHGQGTTIIHDSALGGHDDLFSYGAVEGPGFSALRIKADDIADLHFDLDQFKLTITNTVTGSSVVLQSTMINRVTVIDSASTETTLSPSWLAGYLSTQLGVSYTSVVTSHDGDRELVSVASGTNDVLQATIGGTDGIAYSQWLRQDGRGGSDTYYGSVGSDIFVYSGGGDDVIQGLEDNAFSTIGYDIVDFRSASISSSVISTAFARSGDNLIFTDGSDSLTIKDFFASASLEAAHEQFFGKILGGAAFGNFMGDSTDIQNIFGILVGLASDVSPFSVTRVVDSFHFTDRIVSYAEIAALFPDHAVPTPGDDVLYADELGDTIDALAGNDIVYGNANANSLIGNDGDDVLYGDDGDDTLDGGSGNNTLVGGNGNDIYIVSSATDVATEEVDAGYDLVQSSVSFTLGANIEDLALQGSDNIDGTGNALDNFITGNEGSNVIDGGEGGDIMIGGLGDDSYYIDSLGDLIIENEGEGNDTVYIASSISSDYTIQEGIENVVVLGSDNFDVYGNSANNGVLGNNGNNLLSGDDGNDTLLGGGGNDTLIGGAGTDSLKGGTGNDLYIISASGDNADVITEYSGEGTDTVESAITFTLGSNLENLTLTYSANINGTGNSLNNVLTGNGGNNTLTGGGGNDTLDGGAGTDTLIGGTGDDTYILAASGDTITENNNEGTDTVVAGYSYTLGSNLENLSLSGSGNFTATGNTLNNVLTGNSGTNTLTGNAGNDTLKGGAGNDQLLGGVGNDTYVLNRGDGSDAITENDSTAGNTDVARFGESGTAINHDQLWFKMNGSNLEISVIGSSDKFVINSWSAGSARQVESFVASDGYHMTNAQVAGLVSAMASFTPPASGTTTLDPGTYSTVLSQIAVAWSA